MISMILTKLLKSELYDLYLMFFYLFLSRSRIY